MEKIKCLECGSGDIVKKGAFYVCQNCKTMYRIDGIDSELASDDITSANDNDVLKSIHYRSIGHCIKLSVDLYSLQNPSVDDVKYVINSLTEKMNMAIDEAYEIEDKDNRHKALIDLVEEYNTLCYSICAELLKNMRYEQFAMCNTYSLFENAYIDVHNNFIDYELDAEEKRILRYFGVLNNEFSDKTHRIMHDINQGTYKNPYIVEYKKGKKKIIIFLRGYGLNFNENYVKKHGKLPITIYFPLVACFIFLLLTVFSIARANKIENIFFYALSSIACGYGVYQIYDLCPYITAISMRTLVWIVVLWFAFLDFGTGLFIVWRLLIGIILCVISYFAFDRYIEKV